MGLPYFSKHILAGMPSFRLTDIAKLRLGTLSFFFMVLLVSALGVMLLWNSLRRDFPRLPRLSYIKALAMVGLWGMLFVLILTMISGARELMTPGAWEKDGSIYRLKVDAAAASPSKSLPREDESQRRARLERLKDALWAYAARHGGNFPPDDQTPEIPLKLWETADMSHARYLYFPGRKAGQGADLLACEPSIFAGGPLGLRSNSEIKLCSEQEIDAAVNSGNHP